jgi:integrase/recombinase XerD
MILFIQKNNKMNTKTDFAKYLSKYLSSYLPHERNVSPNTIAAYRDSFVLFINYMKDEKHIKADKITLESMTKDNVISFLNWLSDQKGCNISTRNCRLAAIHSFISYLQYEKVEKLNEWQSILSIKAMKKESNVPNYLTVDGIKLLLAQPDVEDYCGLRHLAILALMYDTGCRVQELIDLTVDSLRIQTEPYTIRIYGKGKKTRIVPMVRNQIVFLRKYMDRYRLNDDNCLSYPLFFNNRGEKITRTGVTYILKKYADMARQITPSLIPERISCSSFRHSKAMHLLQAGVNLIWIRDLLGHTTIQTTEIYARADSKQKRVALERAYTDILPDKTKDSEWQKDQTLLDWLKGLQKK